MPKDMSVHSGRKGAFRAAKKDRGIPKSQKPIKVIEAINKQGKVIPGRDYYFEGGKVIRNHTAGHSFPDGTSFGRHFNAEFMGRKWHYFY